MDKLDKHDEQFEAYLRQFRLRTLRPLPEIASLNRRSSLRWFVAAAAGVVLLVGLSSMFVRRSAVGGPRATVSEAGNPSLYKVGETIEAGRAIRSNSAAGLTLDLNDGSQIEMRAQSELQLEAAADGIRVRLNDGSILVTASKQRQGHLYVQTRDLTASVVGTVFLVNAEPSGTQVAVVEGEVRVQQGTAMKKLLPGEQMASSPSIALQPVAQEIAWSRKASEYAAMLPQQSATAPTAVAETQDRVTPESQSSINALPFKVQVSFIKVTPELVRYLLTVQMNDRDLAFQDSNGRKVAHVNISGGLYRIDNLQVQTYSTSMTVRETLGEPVFYQQTITLVPGIYKLQLTIQDPQSQRVGVQALLVRVPRIENQVLLASSMILAYSMSDLTPSMAGSGLGGDFKIRPSASGEFRQNQSLNVWQEFYGLAVDPNTHKPSATFELLISQNKREVIRLQTDSSQQKDSDHQLQYISTVSLAGFVPGDYDVQLKITDNLAKESLVTTSKFSVLATQAPAQITQFAPSSDDHGRTIFLRACTTCHDASVTQRKSLPSRDQYANMVSREMAKGAALYSAEVPVLIDYLFKMFGMPSPQSPPSQDDPGREIFLRACTTCHDAKVTQRQSFGSRDEYANLVSREMSNGAALSSMEASTLIDYLFKMFGRPYPRGKP